MQINPVVKIIYLMQTQLKSLWEYTRPKIVFFIPKVCIYSQSAIQTSKYSMHVFAVYIQVCFSFYMLKNDG